MTLTNCSTYVTPVNIQKIIHIVYWWQSHSVQNIFCIYRVNEQRKHGDSLKDYNILIQYIDYMMNDIIHLFILFFIHYIQHDPKRRRISKKTPYFSKPNK